MKTKQLFITLTAVALCLSTILAVSCSKKDGTTHRSVESVKLDAATKTVQVGESVTLTVTITPEDAEYAEIKVSSSAQDVATAEIKDKSVTVKGIKAGETDVVVTVESSSATCHVTVSAPEPEPQKYTVKLNAQKGTVEVGKTIKLTATVEPTEGANAVWKSGDEKVAKVTGDALKGTVTGVAEGKTFIYCIVNEHFKDSCEVTVSSGVPVYPEAPDLKCVKIGDTWWAPVNCGYVKDTYNYGKLYQWGRKNGCGYNDGKSFTETIIQEASTTTEAIEAKDEDTTIFYKVTSFPYEWLTPQDTTRWNSNTAWPGKETSPKKTDYDPCPDGWRVPTAAELTSLLGSHTSGNLQDGTGVHSGMNGKWFDGSTTSEPTSGVFLPAAGVRYNQTGNAIRRGEHGYYWSSSVGGGQERYLYFQIGSAQVSFGRSASGHSVRCVKE